MLFCRFPSVGRTLPAPEAHSDSRTVFSRTDKQRTRRGRHAVSCRGSYYKNLSLSLAHLSWKRQRVPWCCCCVHGFWSTLLSSDALLPSTSTPLYEALATLACLYLPSGPHVSNLATRFCGNPDFHQWKTSPCSEVSKKRRRKSCFLSHARCYKKPSKKFKTALEENLVKRTRVNNITKIVQNTTLVNV